MGIRAGDPSGTASTQLLIQIQELLETACLTVDAVERIAVAIGPGSFTGLRIGLATVKGLAATLGCAVNAIPTLQAVAGSGGPGDVVALLPAGRGEVFTQTFVVSENSVIASGPPEHLPLASLVAQNREAAALTWIGAGGVEYEAIVETAAEGRKWRIALPITNLAAEVLAVARAGAAPTDPADLTAMYVRLSDAELKQRCQP